MDFRLDKGTGYMYSYQPKHPCANSAGKVMEHVYVVWKHTGQIPNKDECIHHKDRNKTNNDISNLVLMTQSDHARLHQFEDKGGKPPSELICEHCEKEFITGFHQARFCSQKCATISVRKFEISKEELNKYFSMPLKTYRDYKHQDYLFYLGAKLMYWLKLDKLIRK